MFDHDHMKKNALNALFILCAAIYAQASQFRRTVLIAVLGLFAAFFLAACGAGTSSSDSQVTASTVAPSSPFQPRFAAARGQLPFPDAVLTNSSGVVTIPNPTDNPAVTAVNSLDGFSTVAPITLSFSEALAPSVATAADKIFVHKVRAVSRLVPVALLSTLTFGVDFAVVPSGATLAIIPLKPLAPSSDYLITLKTGLMSANGNSLTASDEYQFLRGDSATNPAPASLESLRGALTARESFIRSIGIANPEEVAASWVFKTQSVGDVLSVARDIARTTTISVSASTFIGSFNPSANSGAGQFFPNSNDGTVEIYALTLTVPYYLDASTPTGVLAGKWEDADGGAVSGLSSTPARKSLQTIPVLVTWPNTITKDNGGAPVVIFQHGITRNRADLLALTAISSQLGMAGIAIDLPLHGLFTDRGSIAQRAVANATSATSSIPALERHFHIDVLDNTTPTRAGPDGIADDSGAHFLNLASFLTARDNIRQGAADLYALTTAVKTMNAVGGAGADFDANRIHFIGMSLGAIVGTPFLALETDVQAAGLVVGSGGLAKMLDFSDQYRGIVRGSLAPVFNYAPDTVAHQMFVSGQTQDANYEQFLLLAQTALDSADPINHIVAASSRSLMVQRIQGDAVVPNCGPGAPLSGTNALVRLIGNPTPTNAEVSGASAGTDFFLSSTTGTHSSFLGSSADLLTLNLQFTMINFLATNGSAVAFLPGNGFSPSVAFSNTAISTDASSILRCTNGN